MRTVSEIAIFNVVFFHAGAVHGVLDRVSPQSHWRCDVEPAPAGFGQPGTRIRNNNGFTHFFLPWDYRFWLVIRIGTPNSPKATEIAPLRDRRLRIPRL